MKYVINSGGEMEAGVRVYLFPERVDESDGLYGLAEAHLISQDDVGVLREREAHPVETLQLVGVELTAARVQARRLLR